MCFQDDSPAIGLREDEIGVSRPKISLQKNQKKWEQKVNLLQD